MERKSAILAIADPNTLSAIGLEKILTEMIPSVDIRTFGTFEALQAADDGQFAHYFIASRIYFEHTAFFRNNARQTIVLLQNKNSVLPLQRGKERIAVIGPNANDEPLMWGNYNGTPTHTVTILDGIRAKQKQLYYEPGCDLTYDKIMDCLMATQCSVGGKKGLRGTFWSNTEMEGKPITTQYYTTPLAVTTAGMHNFAPGVPLEDFSAKYETVFTPKESGEYVVNVEGCGDFGLYIDGERKMFHHTWRTTPTRTVIEAQAGQSYQIEVRFQLLLVRKCVEINSLQRIAAAVSSPVSTGNILDLECGAEELL
jgi:hypothetical protein